MMNFACFTVSWPILLFIFGIMLAFVSLIVGGIAWAFSLISGVPSWKTLSVEAIVLALTALIYWPLGYDGETVFYLSTFGAVGCLLLLTVKWVVCRFRHSVESDITLKPYSFCLSDDSPAPAIQE